MKLIKFKQTNCTPCNILDDTLKREGFEVDKTINLTTGTSEEVALADSYNIMSTPVLLLIDDEGNEIDRVRGIELPKVMAILEKRYN